MRRTLLFTPAFVWVPLAMASAQNVVVVQQNGMGSQQAIVTQHGTGNVATIRQVTATDTTQVATVLETSQPTGSQTIIRQTAAGHSVYIQQTSPAVNKPSKQPGKNNPK